MEVLRDPGCRASERGVTLVETLVALLILSFVAVSTLAMFSQGMRLNRAGTDYTALTNVAKDKCEELLAMNYDAGDLTPDVEMNETIGDPPMEISWFVAEHEIIQGRTDPAEAFGADPMISTSAAGTGNVKVIRVTVRSSGVFGLGRREVSVQGVTFDNT